MNPENRYNLRTHGNHPVDPATIRRSIPSTSPVVVTTVALSINSSMATPTTSTSTRTSTSTSTRTSTSASTSTGTTPLPPGPVLAATPRHQLEAFSGVNQDPKRWLAWYDRYCAYYRLSQDADKMADFPFHLTEHARAWYDDISVPPTFDLLREMFEARFQQTHSMDFMSIKQAPSENVQNYFLRLCKCKPNGLTEEWIKGIAIRGLRDDIRTIVMPQNPATLEETGRASLLAEETLSMSATASVATMQQSNFESVVLEQLAQLKLELDQMRQNQHASSAPDQRDNRQGYDNRRDRRPPQDYRKSKGYQQPRPDQYRQPQHKYHSDRGYQHPRPNQGQNRRGGYRGNGGKQFPHTSSQSNNQ